MSWWPGSSSKPKLLETAKFSIIADLTITNHELGRGSYGTVYAAEYGGKPCVAKEIHPQWSQSGRHNRKDTPTPLEYFFKEINTLSSLKHPSIVQFLGVYFKEKSDVPILVMERMWKNMYSLLEERSNQLPLVVKTHILYDVACGLHYLHTQEKPVVHRDLTASNILLSEDLVAKIADLGLAKALEKLGQKLSTAPGNEYYMPPETLQHKPTYDSKLDVFSFGCTAIHIVTENFPRPSEQFEESMESSVDGGNSNLLFLKVPEVKRRQNYFDLMLSTPLLRQIAMQCLQDNPIERPTASYICNELRGYLEQLEKESTVAVNHYKLDKLSLLQMLEKTEEERQQIVLENESIQNELDESKELVQEKENLIKKFSKEKQTVELENESLQKQLIKQEQIKKELATTCQNEVKRLREEIKLKQQEINVTSQKCDEMGKEIQDLETKVKGERKKVFQEQQRSESLEGELQKVSKTIQTYKEANNTLTLSNESLMKERDEFKVQSNKMETNLQLVTEHADAYKIENDNLVAKQSKQSENEENLRLQLNEIQQKYKFLQENFRMQQEEVFIQSNQNEIKRTSAESRLFRELSEIQFVYEKEHQKLQNQHQLYIDLKKKFIDQKQQLDDKSGRLSTLEFSLNETKELSHSIEKKLKELEEVNATLNAAIKNNDKLYRNLQGELEVKEESLKSKASELHQLKKEHADEMKNLQEQHSREIEDLRNDHKIDEFQAIKQKEDIELLNQETKHKSDLIKIAENKIKTLQNELQLSEKLQNELKRQIKYQEQNIQENIRSAKKYNLIRSSDQFKFDARWHPYLSLPVKRIASSATVVKDKIFITGGYQLVAPNGKDLDSYLKSIESGNEVFCFHTGKCRCASITSPVVLGGVASVNGQCVLVSGAEGNTLTGNVYVLCEEGSDEQWKKFSEPVPTPRILSCVCSYGDRWMIVCGGFTCKEGSNLFEAVNVVEILDTTSGEWYKLSEEQCPNVSNVISCAVAGDDIYVIGDAKILSSNIGKLIMAVIKHSDNSVLLWTMAELQMGKNLHPFSVVEAGEEPVIIASFSDSEDDVTCVLMKDTTDTWKKMSEAVECQHCSAVVVTPTLELLLFGGSEKVTSNIAVDTSQKGSLVETLRENLPVQKTSSLRKEVLNTQENTLEPDTVTQPPAISFTGPIHTKQFDHKGGTFQSPVHKISIVVPPNAIDDGEKVTVHMRATTSGPFDLPEDCKLRSAVVWLGSGSDVVLKRSIAVVVPHSAVFTGTQHHSMMRFLTCEDCEGPRYKFSQSVDHFGMDNNQGCIWFKLNKSALMAVAASSNYKEIQIMSTEDAESEDEFYEASEDVSTPHGAKSASGHRVHHHEKFTVKETPKIPPARYAAKLLWPHGPLPNSFRADIFYLQSIPTELYKVNTLYRKAYYEDNGAYPEIVETEFMIDGDGTELKCVLPCSGSSECDCLSGWSVTQMNDISEIHVETESYPQYETDPGKCSFKFTCHEPKAYLTCCFAFPGGERLSKSSIDQVPPCLQRRYGNTRNSAVPFIVEKGVFDLTTKKDDK